MTNLNNQHILISRVDAIGDVVLTLPLCGYLKSIYPDVKISFLGRTYTGPIIKCCGAVDHFINYDDLKAFPEQEQILALKAESIDTIIHVYPQKKIAILAKKAGIKNRIGTTNRTFHWLTCNKLVRLSRKNSDLHEAQLNIGLLKPLGIKSVPQVSQLVGFYHFRQQVVLPQQFARLLASDKFNIILHPKSNGSGREWGLNRFAELIALLPADQFNIFISGSDKEKELLKDWLPTLPAHINDITGKLTLHQFIAFIAEADGLIAASTGPLHIAAMSGTHALGLYPTTRPMHAGRWGPIGKQAEFVNSGTDELHSISAGIVYDRVKAWL
ncbi:ADP-heptose:LPS heptosyltransferase [Mucilaginibacter gracilis]|uniref:ADP-heptose:LPS heptosyltransferase n=1 Tax=Mucilaginibacter gracilis TaxID=423350 RepID=A0A495JB02_9SPHI|nr:glycosyltransferase family 9 protein [Mucilaginibacter gracilis]RKR85668.1 ADP-heptose:LPS heptosyltransferase [Mucilaginibacter gracilis]